MKNCDVIIAGGCSAGLAAAIGAKRLHPGLDIAVLEKNQRAGKKILATGNGKCNITNLGALSHPYRNADFAQPAMEKYNPQAVIDFFVSMGLLCYADSEGRVYPRSNTASSVLDVLRFEAEKLGVEIVTETPVTNVTAKNGRFYVNGNYSCEKLILACGGKASPSQGSDGSGYPLAKMLGHTVTRLYPALVPLSVKDEITKSLKGIRARSVKLTLDDGCVLQETCGEILFADHGLSGIAAMELAANAEKSLAEGKAPLVHIDFAPDMTEGDIIAHLAQVKKIHSARTADILLGGLLPKAVGIALCKECGIGCSDKPVSALTEEELHAVAVKVKNFTLTVKGTKGYANAQVTSGGIPVNEIDPSTMQSLVCPNLYFAGEIVDVHGGCGGFNLQWAWASGLLAGELK
ncbi:MAG: NAD(P)/FAD-dependent oxidoreductase [Clostridia bacterium]|nr:NAD(P)/FAD-dependent oxidoreductase [Clostridia bacterium]